MRLLGIGPVGTLVASGVLKNREPLLLADFENRTADTTLGPSLTEAMRVDLSQSPTVRLVDQQVVRDALQRKIEQKSFGTYIQEQFGWRDRLVLTPTELVGAMKPLGLILATLLILTLVLPVVYVGSVAIFGLPAAAIACSAISGGIPRRPPSRRVPTRPSGR